MATASENPKAREELLAYLVVRAAKFRGHARKNDAAATFCYLAAIGGSFAATLCAAFTALPGPSIAVITAIPGTALLFNSVFAFERKSRWHRKRKLRYDALALRLKYEDSNVSAISQELRDLDERLDADYPQLGATPDLRKQNSLNG